MSYVYKRNNKHRENQKLNKNFAKKSVGAVETMNNQHKTFNVFN